MFDKKDELAVNTIRALSIDAVEKANSGHPGLTMSCRQDESISIKIFI